MITSSPFFQLTGVRDLMFGGELQRIDDAQDLIEIAARARRIIERELDLLVGPDDEDRAHRERIARIGMDHPIEIGDLAVRIGD